MSSAKPFPGAEVNLQRILRKTLERLEALRGNKDRATETNIRYQRHRLYGFECTSIAAYLSPFPMSPLQTICSLPSPPSPSFLLFLLPPSLLLPVLHFFREATQSLLLVRLVTLQYMLSSSEEDKRYIAKAHLFNSIIDM